VVGPLEGGGFLDNLESAGVGRFLCHFLRSGAVPVNSTAEFTVGTLGTKKLTVGTPRMSGFMVGTPRQLDLIALVVGPLEGGGFLDNL
jgi:hypothetical protein